MFYRLVDRIALRKWKYVDRSIYVRGREDALGVTKEEFALLLLCDGKHDLEDSPLLDNLLSRGLIEKCHEGEEPSEWSKLKEYDNTKKTLGELRKLLISRMILEKCLRA